MSGSRILLMSGAAVLAATACFHLTGLETAWGWLEGQRGTIVGLLWATLAIDWFIVVTVWIYAGIRRAPSLRWPVALTALIPAVCGTLLLAMVDARHPGGYMLIVAAVLAWAGAWRLETTGRAS